MATLEDINESWGWTGLVAVELLAENDFGNLIMRDEDGGYWWLCPQELRCQLVARHRTAFEALSYNQHFLACWYATELRSAAYRALGPLAAGRKYCMTVPTAQGGDWHPDNLTTAPLSLLIRFTGEVAEAIDSAR
ncbi:MAG TPA: DUF1851 domain-containing protein [Telluria sp.]|nr:DUF1851 domain-containing protein [Telluria sp.]